MLVSGSSAAIEFNRERFIDRAYRQDMGDFFIIDPEKTRMDGIHAKINMNLDDKKFSFINAGFPVNFDGRIECIPYQIIQLTHCMLIAASQETLGKKHGLHHLNNINDNWIYNEGLNMLKRYARQ